MRCGHCGTPIGEYFLMVAYDCDHFSFIGIDCCKPRIGARRPQKPAERETIMAEVRAIFEAR